MILAWICSLTASPGGAIIYLLKSLGLQGFPLLLAALAISLLILAVSYFLAMWGINQKKKS
jgi:hypothetical protein